MVANGLSGVMITSRAVLSFLRGLKRGFVFLVIFMSWITAWRWMGCGSGSIYIGEVLLSIR